MRTDSLTVMSFGQQRHELVGEASARCDRIKRLDQIVEDMGLDQFAGFDLVLDHDRRNNRQSRPFTGQKAHHRHIVDLGGDLGADFQTVAQSIKSHSHAAGKRGQDQRRVFDWISILSDFPMPP